MKHTFYAFDFKEKFTLENIETSSLEMSCYNFYKFRYHIFYAFFLISFCTMKFFGAESDNLHGKIATFMLTS